MTLCSDIPRCQHIKVNGVQCASPALRHKRFCHFHFSWREFAAPTDRQRKHPSAAAFSLPPLEDASSIQLALMRVMQLVVNDQIDTKKASLLFYALQTASSNLKNAAFEPAWNKVVVNPKAVARTPLEITTVAATQDAENALLAKQAYDELHPEQAERAKKVDAKDSATVVVESATKSSHTLPMTPREWDYLWNQDWVGFMMSTSALHQQNKLYPLVINSLTGHKPNPGPTAPPPPPPPDPKNNFAPPNRIPPVKQI
jgi:hypothetical protein